MSYLCVPIFVTDLAKTKRDIALALEAGADMIELRLDRIEHFNDELQQIIAAAKTRFVLTCRPISEGGLSNLDAPQRAQLLAELAGSDDYADLELASAAASDLPKPQKWIVSSHDFQGWPAKMHNIISEMNATKASVNKIAWKARTIRDNLEAFELLQQSSRPTIALCMGEAGVLSRILAKKFGAFLTFASLEDQEATAPGQINISEMKNLYHWDAIESSTKVYGVVANPVRHSMSPAIHNAAFDATGYDGVYLPLLVESSYESFKAFIETFVNFAGLDLSGLSITIPHKQNALQYLREKGGQIEPLATSIGAVNTIAIDREGGTLKLSGTNTDYAAILDSITDKLAIRRENLRGMRVAVLGAGGTSRAAVAALAHYGADVWITNRTPDRAKELAGEFNGRSGKVSAVSIDQIKSSAAGVWINTTSVGMFPHVDDSPLADLPKLTPNSLVFDTVYNPIKTKLLTQAEQSGAKTINGVEMFVRQAAAQFETWTKLTAPRDVMRRVVEDRLSR